MAVVDISLTGDKELMRLLDILPPTLQKKVIRRTLRNVAKIVLKHAKAKVPTDSRFLISTLRVRAGRRSRRWISMVVQAGGEVEVDGVDDGYVGHVELGTSKMQPRPFLRPALHENRERLLKIISTEVRRELFKESRRVRR